MPFHDRRDAGRRLIGRLRGFRFQDDDVVVLGITRGGMPVAYEVAVALRAPLDVAVVRKLPVPFQPRLAFGAIGENGVRVIDDDIACRAFVSGSERVRVETEARRDMSRSALRYRATHAPIPLAGVTVIVVDDGVATGASARAACAVARAQGARRVLLAVPVGSPRAIRVLAAHVDHIVCLETPEFFHSIAQWYQEYDEVSDREIIDLLDRAANCRTDSGLAAPPVG
ncbi:phosphoribosyltransferase [Nocardia bovistercoris]|uniref:Phosphoribosyltransferase n=1 Tax=Nocardia bovistercoris TaxID=2785916 RepID=A0A931IAH7_9NOCA|nr:phosphoribosyltransferase family protein [Nocardia bovistercoris]MBH0776893.1 phosphoribosyltransferase [Nocardia bovistercoris]